MPFDLEPLARFTTRAAEGAGRIRLSGKDSNQGQLSTYKGTLAGRVVEWFRGSKEQRADENREVTRLFIARRHRRSA